HLPIARDHAVRRVGVGTRRAQRRPLLERSDLEIGVEPVPRFAHAIVAAHLVEAQNQIHVIERRFHHHVPPSRFALPPARFALRRAGRWGGARGLPPLFPPPHS